MHVFGRWEEAGVPGENPRLHGENMQTPHRKNQPGVEPGTLCCVTFLLILVYSSMRQLIKLWEIMKNISLPRTTAVKSCMTPQI